MKLKIITGFRSDQYHTIDSEEAHKAYFLFLNPDARGVFNNGVALIGKNIQGIEPDWNATMGWNPSHKLAGDDWNEIRSTGKDAQMQKLLTEAKQASFLIEKNPELMNLPLSQATPKLTSAPEEQIKLNLDFGYRE